MHWWGQNKIQDGTSSRLYRLIDHKAPQMDDDQAKKLSIRVSKIFASETSPKFRAQFGDVYTWDYVVDGKEVTKEVLARSPKSCCVEMEAGGFLQAVNRFQAMRGRKRLPAFIVRGISDYAEEKDSDDIDRVMAANNAATAAVRLAADMCDPNGWDLLSELP